MSLRGRPKRWATYGAALMVLATLYYRYCREEPDPEPPAGVPSEGNGSDHPMVLLVGPGHPQTYESARPVALLLEEYRRTPRRRRATKVIFLATPFHGSYELAHFYAPRPGSNSFRRYSCPYSNCRFTKEREEMRTADAALFHLRDLSIVDLSNPRGSNQSWILYTMEPPWLEIADLSRLEGLFNWTMSYRSDSDIALKYGFVGARTERYTSNLSFKSKSKMAVWVASDCCTESRREEYIAELRGHMEVDVLGSCGRPFCSPAESRACYRRLSADYLFYLSFENSLCRDYVTEKFYNVLEHDMVPVVLAAGAEWLEPRGGYVDASAFPDPAGLAAHLKDIAANESRYASFFRWKLGSRAYHQAWQCQLCRKLNEGGAASADGRLRKWGRTKEGCRQWKQNRFLAVDSNRVPCYHTHRFRT